MKQEANDSVRLDQARAMLSPCRVCPRQCMVDRLKDELGFCRVGARPRVASVGLHFGEESVLVGARGSGTIFFEGCNLGCVFCQNCNIAFGTGAPEVSAGGLARMMLDLQRRCAVNINLVTPSHVAPQVLEAIGIARRRGLVVPVVYNSGGYDSADMLQFLEGSIDVYMPDFKYASAEAGAKYSGAPDYPRIARSALAEMYRQVGPLQLDERGLAVRGVLVRHLVLPMDLAESGDVVRMVAETAPGCAINIMDQYRPCHRAGNFPELLTLPRHAETERLRAEAAESGLVRADSGASA